MDPPVNTLPEATISTTDAKPESELRQRKPTNSEASQPVVGSAERYMHVITQTAPVPLRPYLVKATPAIAATADFVTKCIPMIQKAHAQFCVYREKFAPYRLDLLLPSLMGLIMCFFGGSFLTLIAAVEAYRLCGWDKQVACAKSVVEQMKVVIAKNKEDDEKDDDGDGVKDVCQVSAQELVIRKSMLFLRSIDPQRLSDALAGLHMGFMAVIATLKLQFAKAITLGTVIGSIIERPVMQHALPVLDTMLPAEYKKWARPVLSGIIKWISISLAWFLQRIVSAYHSAIRGGHMCARNIIEYMGTMKVSNIKHEETYIDEVAGYALAALGLWFQLSRGFSLPFPLNILLLPVSIAERVLMWMVNTK